MRQMLNLNIYAKIRQVATSSMFKEKILVFSHFKSLFLLLCLVSADVLMIAAQENKTEEKPKKEEKKETKQQKLDPKNLTAEQVAESVVYVYSGATGREGLKQIRRTTIESGRLSLTNADGTNNRVTYERRVLRGENLEKERVRLDQEFPNAKYALIYNDKKIVGLYNESVFAPRDDASKAFQNQIWHGLEALLRYKENGSTLELSGREKFMGVDFYVLQVTDKENRKTKFFISAKTFRVMWLEYTDETVKYVRKFYDYRAAQGTLVPYRTVLLANDKQIEETTISTSTFGQKLDEEIFKAN
jgi:hypothetical protein